MRPWSGEGGSTACWAADPPPAQPLPRAGRRGARGRGPRVADPERARRGGVGARARLGAPARVARRARPARRRPAAGLGDRRGAARGRPRRARAQRASGVRLARAGGGARGRRAGRAAPAQLPARVRGRDVLHPRGGLHSLPRPEHAPRRGAASAAARVPEGLVYGAALALWQRRLVRERRRVHRAERVRARPPARARRAARRPRARHPVGPAVVRIRVARRFRALRPRRRASVSREGVRRRDRGVPSARACRS